MADFPRSPLYARVSAKPRLPDYTWVQSATTLGIPEPPAPMPFRQQDWPVPFPQGYAGQDWIDTGLAWTSTPQPPPPNAQRDWPVPRGPRRARPEWVHHILPWQEPSPPPPLANYDWPVPRGSRRNPQDWSASFNLNLTLADTRAPILWRRKPRVDFTAAILSQPLGGRPPPEPEAVPFAQRDWPLPQRHKARLLPTWIDSFKLPLQGVLPPRQLDWPNPRGPRSNDLRGFALRNLPIALVQPQPHNQYDWPVPKGKRQPVITARDFVHGANPPIPPVYDRALTLENERRRVRFLGRLNSRVRFLKNEIRR